MNSCGPVRPICTTQRPGLGAEHRAARDQDDEWKRRRKKKKESPTPEPEGTVVSRTPLTHFLHQVFLLNSGLCVFLTFFLIILIFFSSGTSSRGSRNGQGFFSVWSGEISTCLMVGHRPLTTGLSHFVWISPKQYFTFFFLQQIVRMMSADWECRLRHGPKASHAWPYAAGICCCSVQQPEEASWRKASGGHQQNSFGPLNLKRLKEFFLVLVAVAFFFLFFFSSNLRAAWPSNLLNRRSNDVTARMFVVPGKTRQAHRKFFTSRWVCAVNRCGRPLPAAETSKTPDLPLRVYTSSCYCCERNMWINFIRSDELNDWKRCHTNEPETKKQKSSVGRGRVRKITRRNWRC